MNKPKFGYCAVTADGLHIGHIRFLNKCAARCENLIVGVMSDSCVKKYKGRSPVMNEKDRRQIVKSLRMVYQALYQRTYEFGRPIQNRKAIYKEDFVIFDSLEHCRPGADMLLPRVKGISSTKLKKCKTF